MTCTSTFATRLGEAVSPRVRLGTQRQLGFQEHRIPRLTVNFAIPFPRHHVTKSEVRANCALTCCPEIVVQRLSRKPEANTAYANSIVLIDSLPAFLGYDFVNTRMAITTA